LAQRPPFVGDNPLEVLRQVTDYEPIPPTRLQPAVPRGRPDWFSRGLRVDCDPGAPRTCFLLASRTADGLP